MRMPEVITQRPCVSFVRWANNDSDLLNRTKKSAHRGSSTGCARSRPTERNTNHPCQIRSAIGLREEENAGIKASVVYDCAFGIS